MLPHGELIEVLGIKTVPNLSNILAKKQNIQPDAWEKFKNRFGISDNSEVNSNGIPNAPLPGSVTLQDHIDLLKKQAATAEADKEKLFFSNETLARALEKLSTVYEKFLANSDATKGLLDGIVDQVRAEHAVMMDALDRLEKRTVGTNAMQAGNLEIERRKNRAGKGKQVGERR